MTALSGQAREVCPDTSEGDSMRNPNPKTTASVTCIPVHHPQRNRPVRRKPAEVVTLEIQPKTPLEQIISLRKSTIEAIQLLYEFESAAAEWYLKGDLDTVGHQIQTYEVLRGGRFVRALIVDGKAFQ
jgi:hypothetical protein